MYIGRGSTAQGIEVSACMCVCMYVCMYGWMDGWMDVCMYVCMYGWMDGWMDGWMYVCMHACMYVRMCVCMYVCMCVCIYLLPEDNCCTLGHIQHNFSRLRYVSPYASLTGTRHTLSLPSGSQTDDSKKGRKKRMERGETKKVRRNRGSERDHWGKNNTGSFELVTSWTNFRIRIRKSYLSQWTAQEATRSKVHGSHGIADPIRDLHSSPPIS